VGPRRPDILPVPTKPDRKGVPVNGEEIKQAVLNILADEFNNNGPGYVPTKPIAERLGIPFEKMRSVIGSLHMQRVIETVVGEEHAMITAYGMTAIRPNDPAVPRTGGTHINFHGAVHGSAIAVDRSQATVTNQNTMLLQNLAREIEQCEEIPQPERRAWAQALSDLSKHPLVVTMLGKLLGG